MTEIAGIRRDVLEPARLDRRVSRGAASFAQRLHFARRRGD